MFSPSNDLFFRTHTGVDTVRFIAITGYDVEENPESGEIHYKIGNFYHKKLHLYVDGTYKPVFEFSYHAYYGLHLSELGHADYLTFLVDQYGAIFKRIDLAIQLPAFATINFLSYLLYFGRRSLQKKRDPWAYWPGREKTIKFYDKQKQQKSVEDQILFNEYPIRFEIEYRSRSVNRIWHDFTLNLDPFINDFLHFYNQFDKLDSFFKNGLEKKHYKAVKLYREGAELNWKQLKDLRAALSLGAIIL